MNTSMTRKPWPHRRTALTLALASAALAACGGGEDEGPLPDAEYVTWSNSANGVVIVDWNNERFAVLKDGGGLAHYTDDRVLNGMVVTGFSVRLNGVAIGTVTYATSTTGNQITDLSCLNGTEMDIVFASNGNWSYRCL